MTWHDMTWDDMTPPSWSVGSVGSVGGSEGGEGGWEGSWCLLHGILIASWALKELKVLTR